jgi:hypothetical protein
MRTERHDRPSLADGRPSGISIVELVSAPSGPFESVPVLYTPVHKNRVRAILDPFDFLGRKHSVQPSCVGYGVPGPDHCRGFPLEGFGRADTGPISYRRDLNLRPMHNIICRGHAEVFNAYNDSWLVRPVNKWLHIQVSSVEQTSAGINDVGPQLPFCGKPSLAPLNHRCGGDNGCNSPDMVLDKIAKPDNPADNHNQNGSPLSGIIALLGIAVVLLWGRR